MPYKAIDVAKWFVSHFDPDVGDVITPLKLQKLLYYAEAWSQVLLDDELFVEQIQAWTHGPVVLEVYEGFKDYGWRPIDPLEVELELDSETEEILNQILAVYGELSARTLEKMTHSDQPWLKTREGYAIEARCNEIIPKQEIKSSFLDKYRRELNEPTKEQEAV
ncbi:MAG: type II toxin-antitoxin system antitoxin SocA domain-containing protein [Cyanobacteria bacterium P01_G01_bin.54]